MGVDDLFPGLFIIESKNSFGDFFIFFGYGPKKTIPPRYANAETFIGILAMVIDMETVVVRHKSSCPFAMEKIMNIAKCCGTP